MRLTVEDATIEHVRMVLDDIRPADLREWYAASGQSFEVSVVQAFEGGDPKRVALLDGVRPLVFWGWDMKGDIWLFATETAERCAYTLHRILKGELERITKGRDRVTATADDRNVKHHRWLRWLGFRPEKQVLLAPFGLPFTVFTKEA